MHWSYSSVHVQLAGMPTCRCTSLPIQKLILLIRQLAHLNNRCRLSCVSMLCASNTSGWHSWKGVAGSWQRMWWQICDSTLWWDDFTLSLVDRSVSWHVGELLYFSLMHAQCFSGHFSGIKVLLLLMLAVVEVSVGWSVVSVSLYVCLCIYALKGKWLQLSAPKLLKMYWMAVSRHALIPRSKGQSSRSQHYQYCVTLHYIINYLLWPK